MSDLLDPATLTPESLYRLQSDTWAQGAQYERERIIKLLEENLEFEEWVGILWRELPDRVPSPVRVTQTIELIKGEQK